jgi:putative flippase GtrA
MRGAVARLLADRRVRFLLSGGVAAVVFYGTFAGIWLFAEGHLPYLVVVLIANIVNAVVTYPIYRRLVFAASGSVIAGFFRFYAVSLWSLAYNFLALPALVEWVHLNVLVAQALVIVTGPLITYQLHRHWAFRHRGQVEPEQPEPHPQPQAQ